ncbi:L-fucose:H+ symporter permease [Pedobacter sp. UC225_61]|uniref:L-fucose:H+ symporter permease n=1 Tax=Pedobacter sp. UC225_61 TaxID=3374623 RepID=UPI0037977666
MFFLGALFIIACGLTFLETAANPYVTILGPPETATQRINFSQSFNGLAAFIAPKYIGKMILSGKELTAAQQQAMSPEQLNTYLSNEAASVKGPYLVLGIIIFIVAIIFFFTKLPDIKHEEEGESGIASFSGAFKSIKLRWGILAQFFYVGAQVCVGSFFIKMSTHAAGLSEGTSTTYLGIFGLAFMLGRFFGVFLMRYINPRKLLIIYAIICSILTAIAIFASGMIVVYMLIGIAFFMSIMFPTIFSIGIEGLGHNTKIGSSLIVMAIVGGAALPPILGLISDATQNIQYGYLVPLICFIVILIFGISNRNSEKNGLPKSSVN